MQKGMCQELWRDPDLRAIGILPIHQHEDKRIRAIPLATRGEIGKLYLVKGDWNEEFIEECIDFPNGEHDDQVDAATGCMGMLSSHYGLGAAGENEGKEKGKENEDIEGLRGKRIIEDEQIRKDREQRELERIREQEATNAAVYVGE